MLNQFKQYLSTKGISIESEAEEQLTFSDGGLNYIFISEKSDPNYFRLILPGILKPEGDKLKSYEMMNTSNQKFKVAKLTIAADGLIWANIEQFVYSNEGVDLLFDRCFGVLKGIFFSVNQDIPANNE